MKDISEYGMTVADLRHMYDQWTNSLISKCEIERTHFANSWAHGKLITRLWRRHLGVETERTHPLIRENSLLRQEIARLRRMLRRRGVDPLKGSKIRI